jgi:hypothetical protein
VTIRQKYCVALCRQKCNCVVCIAIQFVLEVWQSELFGFAETVTVWQSELFWFRWNCSILWMISIYVSFQFVNDRFRYFNFLHVFLAEIKFLTALFHVDVFTLNLAILT